MLYRTIFFLFLCISVMPRSLAQSGNVEPKEWAPIGAKWWYTYSGAGLGQHYLTLESVKDTVVLGKKARLLDIQAHYGEGFFLDTVDVITYFRNTDFGPPRIIIHQQGDSIFYLRKNKFELLYDFSMKPNDTIAVTIPQRSIKYNPRDTQIFVTVVSNSIMTIDGQDLRVQHRKIAYESGNGYFVGDIVIEKIGDNTFFLPWKGIEYDAIVPYELRCYQDSLIFYHAVDFPCDSTTPLQSSSLILPVDNSVVIYPNPMPSGLGQLQLLGIMAEIWILRDIHGRILYRDERKVGTSSIDIPADLLPGMYFLELKQGGKRYLKRLVVD